MDVVKVDNAIANAKMYKKPFAIKHGLESHPLLSLPRLIALAKSLPGDQVEYASGKVGINQDPDTIPTLDMPATEVISHIEHQNAWMVLKRVERNPEYKQLLQDFLNKLCSISGRPVGEFSDLQGFIFVSSANATTPFHVDAEENVLIQIKGDKFVHIFDNDDRELVSEEAMEISPAKHRNQKYESSYEERAEVFELKAGDGVHIPYLAPHWVRTGESYSISMAMTWKTPRVKRLNKIRLMNGTLRRFNWPQKAPGQIAAFDQAKVFAHDAARLIIDPLRKSEIMRKILRAGVYGKQANYYYKDRKPAAVKRDQSAA